MPAVKGALLLLKVGNGGAPETFTTVGGFRATEFTVNNQTLDATHRNSGVWRQLLSGAGITSVRVSGKGIFTDTASERTVRSSALTNQVKNYELYFGNGDKLSGPFQIAAYERTGDFDEEETFSITLESAGTLTLTLL